MIPDIKELNFPKKEGKQYATLTQATANIADMGEKTITTQVKIDGEIVPDFSFDWAVEFQGEKYIMPLRIPQGAKENTSLNSTIDLTFQHWAIYQLKRWPFVTIQQIAAGTYLPDEEVATVQLNLKDFCILFGQVLEYYYGNAITINLNPAWEYKQEATIITISHTKIWNVLIDAFHDKYGVRWEIKAASDNSNTVKGGERYVIRVGYPTTEVDHIFEYGFEGGLLKVERQVQSEEIRNMLKGRGGETNIPLRYFKDTDPNNPDFRPDPDWVEELKSIYFTNLMPATFRSYVQGWKAAHISKYPGYTAKGESKAYAPWAYRKGYTDTKFAPVEFVADEITINPGTGDKQVEILPGYSPYVKKGSSLDKYGPLPDTLDNNEDIYPTLQGTGLDIAVAVEHIESDDVAESTESDAKTEDKTYPYIIKRYVMQGHTTAADASKRTYFSVPANKKANITGDVGATAYNIKNNEDKSAFITELGYTIKVFNAVTGTQHPASGIPEGNWYFTVEYSFNNTSPDTLNVTLSFNNVKIVSATPSGKWRNTFDIWVKNIWDSTRLSGETDTQYAERVWKPVLGDREGNTAKVVFTSGDLATSEDYEFTIVDYPVPDTDMSWEEKDDDGSVIATHTSHWRITLAKSEAELEATGLYVPSTKKQGKAGDRFVFTGMEMTHVPYVVDAEKLLDDRKKDQLGEVKEIKPTFVVTTDRIRLNQKNIYDAKRLAYIIQEAGGKILTESDGGIAIENSGYHSLLDILSPGCRLRLADKRFIQNAGGGAYETLYLQSITYTYREPTSEDAALNPDVEIVLGNDYSVSANAVSMMQGEISALQRQVGAISNIEQIVRAVGDKLYMRKDGIPERSVSPTQFLSLLTSGDFRAGLIGGAGWGFFKDENGNWVIEADRVNVRQEMTVNTLVINQAEGRGGMAIDTAAYIDGVTRVVETDSGYVCYFDQKGGSVANLFQVDDVAYCSRWTPENAELKFYKRRVVAVGADSITLSKTDVNGTGIPAEGDNIIHYGNYTDATRQYVKVRDVVGGGYERYIENLDSVNSDGTEYYFVGRQAGMYNGRPRFYIGDPSGYVEWVDGVLKIKGQISLLSTIGDKNIAEYISDKASESAASLVKDLDVLYISHNSQTVAPQLPVVNSDGVITDMKGWQTAAPAWSATKYIWQTTYVLKGGGTASFSEPTCISGRDGESGIGVDSIVEQYYLSESRVKLQGGTWNDSKPAWEIGKFYWTRSKITYTNGNYEFTSGVCVGPESGYTDNLLPGTRDWSGWNTDGSELSGDYMGLKVLHCDNSQSSELLEIAKYSGVSLKNDKVYTMSFFARGSGRLSSYLHPDVSEEVYFQDGSVIEGNTRPDTWSERVLNSEWVRYCTVFRTKASGSLTSKVFLIRAEAGCQAWIAGAKLEEYENLSPQWAPASDEIAAEPVYILDLDKETAPIACDAAGIPVASGVLATTRATVFRGATEDSGWVLSAVYSGCSGSQPTVSGDIYVTAITTDVATVEVQAQKAGAATLKAIMSLYKVMPGVDGQDAVLYTIEPSVSSITKSINGEFTNISANMLSCKKYKTVGDSGRQETDEKCLKYRLEGAAVDTSEHILADVGFMSTQMATVDSAAEAIIFTLYEDAASSTVLYRERVPVVSDLGDLSVSGDNIALETGNAWQLSGSKISGTTTTKLYNLDVIAAGSTVTVSFDYEVKGMSFGSNSFILVSGSLYYKAAEWSGRIVSNGTGHMSKTVVITKVPTSEGKRYARLRTSGVTGSYSDSYIRITNFKVEKGHYETPWKPNSSDYNYLTEALIQGGTLDAGLILARLLRLGYSDGSGVFHNTAGMNGLIKNVAAPRDLAIWTGGDPGEYMDENLVAMGWRHDGTGFAAHNTIRFKDNTVELGEGMELTDNELCLKDNSGNKRYVISRDSVGTPEDYLANINISISKALEFTAGNITVYKDSAESEFGFESSEKAIGTYNSIPSGSTVRVNVDSFRQFTYGVWNGDEYVPSTEAWAENMLFSTSLRFYFRETSSGISTYRDIPYLPESGISSTVGKYRAKGTAEYTIQSSTPTTLSISACLIHSNIPGASAWQAALAGGVSGTVTGKIGRLFASMVKNGSDGWVSVWPNAAALVRDGVVLFRVGDYGLWLDKTNGIRIDRNDGKGWVKL